MTPFPGTSAAEADLIIAVAKRYSELPGGGSRPIEWEELQKISVDCYRVGCLHGFRTAATQSGMVLVTAEMRRHLVSILRDDLQARQANEWDRANIALTEALLAESIAVQIPGDENNVTPEEEPAVLKDPGT